MAAAFGVVAGTMTIGLAAPAMASATTDVVVQPGEVRPGEKVTVVGKKCHTDGTAGSLAFVGGAVPLNGAEEVEGRAGLATIKKDTYPGTYTVLVRCGGYKSVGHVVVVAEKGKPDPNTHGTPPKHGTPSHHGSPSTHGTPKLHATPTGGAKTGFGGGAGDSSTALLAGGGVLLLGALGVGTLAVRRREDGAS
ncbi:hypothetical protein [Spirillospora sp. CA-294931]|uniref:hypothetical protein n=1 Tax=Spirillospora sp. CA-294931 TaxID=3240042 RepID=UPI003D9496C9